MSTTIRNDQRNISDINLSFSVNPNTGDLAKLNNFAVIRRSIEYILTLGTLEKPFREDLGSDVRLLLFEVVSVSDVPPLESRIKNAIDRNEPRVKVQSVKVSADFNAHRITVTIAYTIRATNENDTFTTMLNLSD